MLFTILGLNTIVLHILSFKYHHLIICSQQFLQQWKKQQEQHNKLKSTTKIMVPIIDNNDIFFCAVCLPFHSCSSTSFRTFSTLWFAECNPHHGSGCFLLEFLVVFRLKEVQQSSHSSRVSDSMVG